MTEQENNDRTKLLLKDESRSRYVLWAAGGVLAALVAGAWYWYQGTQNTNAVKYVTEAVERGDVHVSVSADGTLAPVRTVSLGSELSGIVREVNVDVNDEIKEGQSLIVLDKRNLEAKVLQNRASLRSAEASRRQSAASLREAELKLKRMQELNRLSKGTMPSKTELETQAASVDTARAAVAVADANIADAMASLQTAENDLSKADIKSPIDGVVLARSVEPGYAVAASLQAVELLTLATDLSQLELEVSVDEADIGVVKQGQKAYFTVSAYPNRRFPAELTKVSYGATTTENVVTYTAYLQVDNQQMQLRPGMTASATISTADKQDVLLVPNSAFRFRPKAASESDKPKMNAMMPGPPHGAASKKVKEIAQHGQTSRTVYVLRDGKPVRVDVVTGLTDGMQTEIVSGDIAEGDKVVVDQQKGA